MSQRGNFSVVVALVFTVLLTFAALAIDISYVRIAQLQAQNAADAGAHAGLVALRQTGDEDEARSVAASVVSQNLIAGKSVTIDSEADITFGGWDFDNREFDEDAAFTNSLKVNVTRSQQVSDGAVDLIIAPLLGWDVASVGGEATGALRYRDTMLVLDITRSFREEIDQAVEAVNVFLDYTYNSGHPGDRMGLVTFVGAAEVWTDLQHVAPNYSTMSSGWQTLDYCWDPIWDENDHTHMQHCCDPAVCPWPWTNWWLGGTNQGSGLELAVDELIEDSDQYALKTIVIISDGQPCCWAPGIIPSCDASRSAYGQAMSDYAWTNDISVFSVSFNDPYNATQSAYMESLIRGYGTFYETPDEDELPEILEAIAEAIPVALVQ